MATVAKKYGNLSFDTINNHVRAIMRAKGGNLADLASSSYGSTLIELGAGLGDLYGYWVESAFENAFLESATSRPAIYAGARMLGCSIRRPMPAKCSIAIRTTRTGIYDTIKVFIPKGTVFGLDGTKLTAMSDMQFEYDRNSDDDETGLMTLTKGMAVLAEGGVSSVTLISNGKQNQSFFINDGTFSDYFGENDPNYADDGNYAQRSGCFTTVTTDATLVDNIDPDVVIDDRLYWRISRRGLKDPAKTNIVNDIENFASGESNYTTNYSVLIETANNGSVSLRFGDGVNSAIPFGNITVKYFSTSGEYGNRMNVAGSALDVSSGNITITQADGTESDIGVADLNICLVTDIRGGMNIESLESIKNNASNIYNSLDRLVTRDSYKTFLSRYTDVKYASAYGEDILNTKLLNGGINVKYMNQIRFSVLKDLYREKDGKYYPTTPNEYFLEGFKVNGLMYTWEYDFQNIDRGGVANGGSILADSIYKGLARMLENMPSQTDDSQPIAVSDPALATQMIMANVIQPLLPAVNLNEKVFSARLSPMDFVVEGSELHTIMLALNRRAMLTVGGGYHTYVYPSVHDMEIHMDVTLFKGHNFTDIRERIKNVIYKFLRDNTEFCTPVYRSKIEALVHQMPEVAGIDVRFVPKNNGYSGLDIADYKWMSDRTGNYVSTGTAAYEGGEFTLAFDYRGTRMYETYNMRSQADIQNKISEYYRVYISNATISDRLIDEFVAYIWQCVMQEVYYAIKTKWSSYMNAGQSDMAEMTRQVMEAVKRWDMNTGVMLFYDGDDITDMSESGTNVLYDYMNCGLNYIKLIRNILCARSTQSLIDPVTGNVTNFSNDNEIVQFVVPNEAINLTVAYESSLLTE